MLLIGLGDFIDFGLFIELWESKGSVHILITFLVLFLASQVFISFLFEA